MRTTLDLDDALLRRAKAQAAEEGKTLSAFLEESLRQRLALAGPGRTAFKLKLVTVKGPLPGGVDFDDRDALYRWMDGPNA